MTNKQEEEAFCFLEKAIYYAQKSLSQTKHFKPFLMLLDESYQIKFYDNEEKNSVKSYELLENIATEQIKNEHILLMALVIDTEVPDNFTENIPNGIRVHFEERTKLDNPIGGRFLYVPYELFNVQNKELFVKLHTPIPVGFPAEYIKR